MVKVLKTWTKYTHYDSVRVLDIQDLKKRPWEQQDAIPVEIVKEISSKDQFSGML
jgi:hypothetical protein